MLRDTVIIEKKIFFSVKTIVNNPHHCSRLQHARYSLDVGRVPPQVGLHVGLRHRRGRRRLGAARVHDEAERRREPQSKVHAPFRTPLIKPFERYRLARNP